MRPANCPRNLSAHCADRRQTVNEFLLNAAEWLGLWLTLAMALSLLAGSVYPAFRRLCASASPAARSAATLGYGLLAPGAAAAAVIAVMLPGWAGLLVPPHCHGSLCEAHTPLLSAGGIGDTVLVAIGSLAPLALAAIVIGALRAGRRRLRLWLAFSRPERMAAYRTVDSPDALAWCFGLWRPRVFVTTALIRKLTPAELDAVLRHEWAHAKRLDNLRAAALGLGTLFWLPGGRRRILSDLSTDSELACDAVAHRAAHGTTALQAALSALQGTPCPAPPARGSAFGKVSPVQRIAALQSPAAHPPAIRAWLFLAAIWCLEVALATGLAHHGLEWLA